MCHPRSDGIGEPHLEQDDDEREEEEEIGDHIQNRLRSWRESIVKNIDRDMGPMKKGESRQDHEMKPVNEGDDFIGPDMGRVEKPSRYDLVNNDTRDNDEGPDGDSSRPFAYDINRLDYFSNGNQLLSYKAPALSKERRSGA